MLVFPRYFFFLILSLAFVAFFIKDDDNKNLVDKNDEVVDRTKNLVINPRLYNMMRNGKRFEIVAARGENNDSKIVVSEVEGKLYDTNDSCLLEFKAAAGEFDIGGKLLIIKDAVNFSFFAPSHKAIDFQGSNIVFDIEKKLLTSSSDIKVMNSKYMIAGDAVEIRTDGIIINKPFIKRNCE